jgi:FkbM family methyltransferase
MLRAVWQAVRPTFNRLGVDVVPHGRYEFAQHVRRLGINVVLDVGANEGQFAEMLRKAGYTGHIVSFEPVSSTYDVLVRKVRNDRKWGAVNVALGETSGQAEILINDTHTTMSSILPMSWSYAKDNEWAKPHRTQAVEIARLDDLWDRYAKSSERVMLKIDTQGYEDQVLNGAEVNLRFITAVQIELSSSSIYQGGRLIGEQIEYLGSQGFRLIDLAPVFRDPMQRLVQIDGFFERF